MISYPKEQLWKLYENLPKEIQGAVFSEENADIIYNTCQKYELKDETIISEISKLVGYVLLGLISPNELQPYLEEDLKVEKDVAKNISFEINRFVFFPLKSSLEQLYNMEFDKNIKPEPIKPETSEPELNKKKKNKDSYREPIE